MKKTRTSGADPKRPVTLAFDIGGTGVKALSLDGAGKPVNDRIRIKTPKAATPRKVMAVMRTLARRQPRFDRASVGFPGVVKNGVIYSAPNLGHGWRSFPLANALRKALGRPVRVANDADVQGLASVSGRGLELVITLGTGFGSVLFVDGRPIHLELAHHAFHKGKSYEDELGFRALKKKGKKRWNRLLCEAIHDLAQTFNYDRLYIGGGNARHISFRLPPNTRVVSNEGGLLGGIKLWAAAAEPAARRLRS